MIKPHRIKPGSTIATVSLSWGGPGEVPHKYKIGKKQLEDYFGVRVIEMKHTMKPASWIYKHPEARAKDLMDAFIDPSVDAIFSTIGGEDSIRILPYINFDIIKNNPKIFLGYSDSTVTHFICFAAGITSYYGPAIMAGFGENGGLFPYMVDSIKKTLFSNEPIGQIHPNTDNRTSQFLSRSDPTNQFIPRERKKATGRRRIQGSGTVTGHLLGGCIDVFPFIIGTSIRPPLDKRKNAILFIETSEEQMNTSKLERIIRNLGSQGIINHLSGILVGRSQPNQTTGEQINYDTSILKIVHDELGISNLPIITNMDFGHTDPQIVIPYGAQAKINCEAKTFSIEESGCS